MSNTNKLFPFSSFYSFFHSNISASTVFNSSALLGSFACLLGVYAQAAQLSTAPAVIFEGEEVQVEVSFVDNQLCSSYDTSLIETMDGYRLSISRPMDGSCQEVDPIRPYPAYATATLPGLVAGDVKFTLVLPGSPSSDDVSEYDLHVFGRNVLFQRKVNLETPREGSKVSGVGLIRGWACQATGAPGVFSYAIDDGPRTVIPYGSAREDTKEVCDRGNAGTFPNTGFGAVVNWNALAEGNHTLNLFLNGVKISERSFEVAKTKDEFLTGLSRRVEVSGFPESGDTTRLEWSEADQNFVITETD